MKLKAEQLDAFLAEHAQGKLSILETLAKFLEIPAYASQETAIAYRIKRAGFPTEATLESYDWNRNPETIRNRSLGARHLPKGPFRHLRGQPSPESHISPFCRTVLEQLRL